MEFVIVLPIYCLLIAFAFVMGELALHAIQLAGGADRSLALSNAAYEAFKNAASPDKDPDTSDPLLSYEGDGAGSGHVSDYNGKNVEWTWNPTFKGPWAELVAATVSDYYTLTPLTRGFVAFWYRDNRRKVETMGGEVLEGSALDEMIKDSGTLGRIRSDDNKGLTGRDRDPSDIRKYGYYTLRRVRIEGDDNHSAYRSWPAGALANGDNWSVYICGEEFLETNPKSPKGTSDLVENVGDDSVRPQGFPETAEDRSVYDTDLNLRNWSK